MAAPKSGIRVVKSSGDVEIFDPNVITTECVEAGIEFWTAAEVALEISKRIYDGISTRDIQKSTLELLYKKSPEIAERYKRFHSMMVRTSENTIEAYDRKKMSRSLIRETNLPKEVAEQLARETEEELRRLKLDFISGPLIREVVNVKLLEHGYEEARAGYTRLGMPVYDATQLIELRANEVANLQRNPETVHKLMADNVFREYTLLKVLPLHLADSHMRGELHIHALEYFTTRPYCAEHDLRWFLRNGLRIEGTGNASVSGPAKNPEVAILHGLKVLDMTQSNFSGGQGLDFLNVWLSPYLKGLDYPHIKQLAKMLIYEISQIPMGRGGGIIPAEIGIEYGVPEGLVDIPAVLPGGKVRDRVTYGDFEEEARMFSRALTEIYLDGDYLGKPFLLPKANYKLRKEDLKKEGYEDFMLLVHKVASKFATPYFMNLYHDYLPDSMFIQGRRLVIRQDDEDLQNLIKGTLRTSSLQLVTLNLPRVAYEAGREEAKLYEIIEDRLNMIREILILKREVITKRLEQGLMPFLTQDVDGELYYPMERAVHSIGYTGLKEMVKSYTGEEMEKSKSAQRFGLEVIRYISEIAERWTRDNGLRWVVSQIEDKDIAHRLAKLDYGQFSDKAVVQGDVNSGKVYYTNFPYLGIDNQDRLLKRLEIEGTFHKLASGGATRDISIREESLGFRELWDLTKKIANGTAIGYWNYSKDMTYCKDCRKLSKGVLKNCPNCGSIDIERFSSAGEHYQGFNE